MTSLLASLALFILGWTAPRTWVPGELVTATMLNTHLRDNMNFLRATAQQSQVFRGMVLRTHPDADKAATQVEMIRCDELVTDAGTRVNPRAGLTADITAGNIAGGLDTGARVAATWYEVYYIFKGPTATSPDNPQGPSSDALILHRAKNHILDQSNTGQTTTAGLRSAASTTKDGQTFQVSTANLKCEFVDVLISKTGTPTGRFWAEIQDNTGNVLVTSDKMDVSLLTNTLAWTRMVFRTPYAGFALATTYRLALAGDFTISGVNFLNWGLQGGGTGSYANGTAQTWDGATWTNSAGNDFDFKIYLTQNDTVLTLPTGYTEKCLLGHVFVNGSNSFFPFTARDRQVQYPMIALVSGISNTVPLLVDCSQGAGILPPVPLELWFGLAGTVNGDGWVISGVPDGFGQPPAIYGQTSTSGSGYTGPYGPIRTEYQAVYIYRGTGTGTGTLGASGYRW